jgi:N-acetylmuramoyl-L-alanine amidase
MSGIGSARRQIVRLLAGVLAAGFVSGGAAAQPAGRTPPAAHRRRPQSRLRVIAIDPGHGGIDPGAIGAGGVFEKRITFATATDLARLLRASRRFRVGLTRGPDEYVPLRQRVARARALHADLFLSLHADALPNPAMRGLSVFTLSAAASDREAAALAASENREIVAGVPLAREPREIDAVLIDLARRQTGNMSLEFARHIIAILGHRAELLDNPRRSAGFVVLTAPDIPSVLVELGCLSNPIEERLLQQPAYQKRLALGLAEAIESFFHNEAAPLRLAAGG